MKNRMYLQLFEDGAGAGSGVQGGSTGTGNGSREEMPGAHPERMEPEHTPMSS